MHEREDDQSDRVRERPHRVQAYVRELDHYGTSLVSSLNARAAACPSAGFTGWQWTPCAGSDASLSDSHRVGNGEPIGWPSAEQMNSAPAGERWPKFSEGNRDA